MTNFTVVSNHGSYRATSHEFKLVFLHRSTVIPVGEDVILKTCFNMFPFSELLNMTQDYDFLVGLLTSVGEAKEYAKEEKIGKIIVLELTSKKCDSLEPMYSNITSISNLYLTGATIPWIGRCISGKQISVDSPPYLCSFSAGSVLRSS
ncbi:uncharacterized protein LOC130968336 isoform X6 [Arachis stenosperma]|uniref:uncharacterized protein LOC130968336 isoform X6 n=1 Tax=Arachis stenosperma TaxID=217475 RepID=UPI0025ACBDA3|nr:uncharacterized protein LOC130968336 isoform X6 [Arachis stenosperma]